MLIPKYKCCLSELLQYQPTQAYVAAGEKLSLLIICQLFPLVLQLWELATGRLKLTLTGHISSVRGVEVSPRQPYLFSCGEDKTVKCWDLEMNKVKLIQYQTLE